MTIEQLIAVVVGVVVFGGLLRTLWNLDVSYEYPLDVKGDRLQEIRYSLAERFGWRRLVVLVVGLPVLSTVVAYLFVVGLRVVLR